VPSFPYNPPGLPYYQGVSGYPLLPAPLQHQVCGTSRQDKDCAVLDTQIDQTKKFRPPVKSGISSKRFTPKPIPEELGNLKTYSNPDILICGNCKELFEDIVDMMDHKKNLCNTRFTCKCEDDYEEEAKQCKPVVKEKDIVTDVPAFHCPKRVKLKCGHCDLLFSDAWPLICHVQKEHKLSLFNNSSDNKE